MFSVLVSFIVAVRERRSPAVVAGVVCVAGVVGVVSVAGVVSVVAGVAGIITVRVILGVVVADYVGVRTRTSAGTIVIVRAAP